MVGRVFTFSLNFCTSRSKSFATNLSPDGALNLNASSARILSLSVCFFSLRSSRSMRESKNVSTVSSRLHELRTRKEDMWECTEKRKRARPFRGIVTDKTLERDREKSHSVVITCEKAWCLRPRIRWTRWSWMVVCCVARHDRRCNIAVNGGCGQWKKSPCASASGLVVAVCGCCYKCGQTCRTTDLEASALTRYFRWLTSVDLLPV